MRNLSGMIMLCALAVFLCASAPKAQTTAPTDPAITSLSVMGIVTDNKAESSQLVVQTAAGNQVTVTLSDRTEFRRIPPGEKTKDKFIKISSTDFAVGDSVFARGRMSEDRKNLPALEFYVMSKGDIATKREREREEWTKRSIAGTISAINADTKEISLDSRTPEGPKPLVITTAADTKFRRYAPDSVRFSDARTSAFSELKVGDQLRSLGSKNADGTRFTPEEIVTGSFQTIGGVISEVNLDKKEIKINDSQSKQPVTIVVSNDSTLRRVTPEALTALAPTQPNTAAAKPATDLQETFDRLPTLTLQELKAGESILVSSTKGADPSRVTAIALVSGVGPLLQNSQGGRA